MQAYGRSWFPNVAALAFSVGDNQEAFDDEGVGFFVRSETRRAIDCVTYLH